MKAWRAVSVLWLVSTGIFVAPCAGAADWPVLTPEDLTMATEPNAPGAPAVFLYRQVDRDDETGSEVSLQVIKVLTEEGRKYADVEILYRRYAESIGGIEARTIRPDGTITKFAGTIYETQVVKAHDVKYMTKTFALPDVQVGTIIEYRFKRYSANGYVYDSQWLLNDDLYTRHGVFTLRANRSYPLVWRWPVGLPPGTVPPERKGTRITMEVRDVPAFVTEEYMPPENALKCRVEFVYQWEAPEQDPQRYWKQYAKQTYHRVDRFIDHRRAMEKALAQIVEAGDSKATKLAKIYARVQRLRNVNFEPSRSDAEREREKVRDNDDAADVWERGYGNGYQITWLFLALLRAAGLDADPVEVSSRSEHFFIAAALDSRELNTNVVRIRLDGREIYADPGTKFAPLGLLPWAEAGVVGLVIGEDGGTWITTPLPSSTESRLERDAVFKLDESGALEGKLTVAFQGLAALTLRIGGRNEDAAARKEMLENLVKRFVSTGIDVSLVNSPDWDSSSSTFKAEFELRVPGWADLAGSRMLLPMAVFRAEEKSMFTHSTREHAIYFEFPYTHEDQVSITVPAGLQPAAMPDPLSTDLGAVKYRAIADFHDGTLTARRHVQVDGFLYPASSYQGLHNFFQAVRSGDEQQIVLSRQKPAAAR